MGFWNLRTLRLEEFRPGILSQVESGSNLTMAVMEIAPRQEGAEHQHPFDQCGIIVEGEIEMSIGEERKNLGPMEAYFVPGGTRHNWKTAQASAKILDIVLKQ